jgi:hypothetical protein
MPLRKGLADAAERSSVGEWSPWRDFAIIDRLARYMLPEIGIASGQCHLEGPG